MQYTNNHEFSIVDNNELYWGDDRNADFEHIETALPILDVELNKELYVPKQDSRFIAIDTGGVYEGTGSTWQKVTRDYHTLKADGNLTKTKVDTDSAVTIEADTCINAPYMEVDGELRIDGTLNIN